MQTDENRSDLKFVEDILEAISKCGLKYSLDNISFKLDWYR